MPRIRTLALTVGRLAILLWAWNSSPLDLKDRLFPKHLAAVDPGFLYRSGQIAPGLIERTLRDLRIDTILDLSHDRGGRDPAQVAEAETARRLGVARVRAPLGGSGRGELREYARAVATLANARRNGDRVLVHCRAGDRRTGAVIAAYYLLTRPQPEAVTAARRELDHFARSPADQSGLTDFLDQSLPLIAARLASQGIEIQPTGHLPRLRDVAAAQGGDSRDAALWMLGVCIQALLGWGLAVGLDTRRRGSPRYLAYTTWAAASALLIAGGIGLGSPAGTLGQLVGLVLGLGRAWPPPRWTWLGATAAELR